MIKVSKEAAVNPKHVMAVMRSATNLVDVKVVLLGMTAIKSDHDFETTVKMLGGKQ